MDHKFKLPFVDTGATLRSVIDKGNPLAVVNVLDCDQTVDRVVVSSYWLEVSYLPRGSVV